VPDQLGQIEQLGATRQKEAGAMTQTTIIEPASCPARTVSPAEGIHK
jgi:hypothetical protein